MKYGYPIFEWVLGIIFYMKTQMKLHKILNKKINKQGTKKLELKTRMRNKLTILKTAPMLN